MNKLLACVLVLASTGCPDIQTDDDEGNSDAPVVEFDPSNRIVPFPNNLLLDRTTGLVNLPASCGETPTAKALRENVLNKLDGFGTFETALTVTFSEPVDAASLADKVVLVKRASAGMAVPADQSQPVPVVTRLGMTARFDASCANPQAIDQLVIIPMVPLDQKSTYVVALTSGIKTASGADFTAGFTWSLIRQPENPVTVNESGVVTSDRTPLDPSNEMHYQQLLGIDLLWRAHAGAMAFLAAKGISHEDVLLAWEFNTQTVTDPLDPTVAGSPASMTADTPLQGVMSLSQGAGGEAFLRNTLPAGSCNADGGPLPCQFVEDVLAGGLLARQYQINKPNPLTEPVCGPQGNAACGDIPGPWADPRTPEVVETDVLGALVLTARTTARDMQTPATCPQAATTGCPTVIFQHGLGRQRTDAFAIASQLASQGFNVVAIDAVAHGSRAVRVSNNPALGCAPSPTPGTAPQCFAPFLSPDLANTRDNIRQTMLDQQALVAALKACGTTACGGLKVDPTKILYIGQSLGGIMGSVTTAMTDIKAAVLNVPGVGWLDILENTQTLAIRCSLVNGLIDAGILTGDKWSPAMPTVGLCTTEEWKNQPGYRQFAVIARWVIDPADPANFTRRLATKRFMIQQVMDDQVVPNIATENEAKLTGLFAMAIDANPAVPTGTIPPVAPTPGVVMDPMMNKYVRYMSLPADAGTGFPGNTYGHGSLLAPAAATPAGQLATAKMQIDALFFLSANK